MSSLPGGKGCFSLFLKQVAHPKAYLLIAYIQASDRSSVSFGEIRNIYELPTYVVIVVVEVVVVVVIAGAYLLASEFD